MKTIITSLVVLTTTISSFANPSSSGCPENCSVKHLNPVAGTEWNAKSSAVSFSVESETSSVKIARLNYAKDDLKSMYSYRQAMQNMLHKMEVEKLTDAMEDLGAENAYSTLMVNLLAKNESDKLDNTIEDMQAMANYSNLMEKILPGENDIR